MHTTTFRPAGWVVSAAAALMVAACSASAPPPPPPPVAAAAPPPAMPMEPPPPAPAAGSDQQFVEHAAAAGVAEVAGGQAARSGAQSRAVRAFGARMVADHTRANRRLMALAQRLGMTPPPPAPPQPPPPGPDFDRQYIGDQVRAHEEAVSLFEAEAQNGQNPQLKRFAKGTLPTLQMHLRHAQGLARRLGV